MLDVLSSAKNTQWYSFPNLCTKYSNSNVAHESIDFQTIPGQNYFVEFNKKSGFELLRTVSKDSVDSIQRIKKRHLEDLSCGAVSKLYGSELAIGMSTGFIQIFSIEKGEFMPFKFKPDKPGNSVVGLDYSNDDAYMAAVYESADICLFGMKTGVKTNSFRLDGSSTVVRFHPVKKFALAVASYSGAVTMLDVQTKKKIFFEKMAHSAPARDIAMFLSSQDVFVSCGYDCNVNVYDLRMKKMVQQYTQSHPMSTISVSTCGTFCVGGNLKGDIISYDFRSLKEPLDMKRAHDSAVVRVAFVPTVGDASSTMFGSSGNALTSNVETPPSAKPCPSQNGSDSFTKFVDVCRKDSNLVAGNESKASVHDSWADLMPGKQKYNLSNLSNVETPVKSSSDSMVQFNRTKRSTIGHPITIRVGDSEQLGGAASNAASNDIENKEEKTDQPVMNLIPKELKSVNTSTPPESRLRSVHSPFDNKPKSRLKEIVEEESMKVLSDTKNQSKIVTMSKSDLDTMVRGMISEEMTGFQQRITTHMQRMTESIKTRIDQRLTQMEMKNKEMQAKYYEDGVQGCINLHNSLQPLQDILEKALVHLIYKDEFALNYFQIRGECMALRQQLGKNPKNGL